MAQKTVRPWGLMLFIAAAIFLLTANAPAQECEEWAAKVVSVQGSVQVKEAGKTEWRQVSLNDTYQFGDIIRVQERGRAAFLL
jgi:hypothetical protein